MHMKQINMAGIALLFLFSQFCSERAYSDELKDRLEMILIQGGTFMRGDVFDEPHRLMLPETPVHEVELDSFYLSNHETRVKDFQKFVKSTQYETEKEKYIKEKLKKNEKLYDSFTWKNPGFDYNGDFPVVWIAWEDAARYCNWLSKKEGYPIAYDETSGHLLDQHGARTNRISDVKGYRLPTEAEWEFAARERGKRVRFGNGKNVAMKGEIHCKFIEESLSKSEREKIKTVPVQVSSFLLNALGLYDMSGNAWEWCCDQGKEYTKEKITNPYTYGIDHAIRGGTYDSASMECNVFCRINFWAKASCGASGFRVARSK